MLKVGIQSQERVGQDFLSKFPPQVFRSLEFCLRFHSTGTPRIHVLFWNPEMRLNQPSPSNFIPGLMGFCFEEAFLPNSGRPLEYESDTALK